MKSKGETSGFTQRVKSVYIDCDGDSVLLRVEQVGSGQQALLDPEAGVQYTLIDD